MSPTSVSKQAKTPEDFKQLTKKKDFTQKAALQQALELSKLPTG